MYVFTYKRARVCLSVCWCGTMDGELEQRVRDDYARIVRELRRAEPADGGGEIQDLASIAPCFECVLHALHMSTEVLGLFDDRTPDGSVDETDDLREQIGVAKQNLTLIRDTYTLCYVRLKNKIEECREQNQCIGKLQLENDILQTRVEENTSRDKNVEDSEGSSDTIHKLELEIEDLEKANRSLTDERGRYIELNGNQRIKLDSLRKAVETLNTQISKFCAENEELKEELESTRKTTETLKTELMKYERLRTVQATFYESYAQTTTLFTATISEAWNALVTHRCVTDTPPEDSEDIDALIKKFRACIEKWNTDTTYDSKEELQEANEKIDSIRTALVAAMDKNTDSVEIGNTEDPVELTNVFIEHASSSIRQLRQTNGNLEQDLRRLRESVATEASLQDKMMEIWNTLKTRECVTAIPEFNGVNASGLLDRLYDAVVLGNDESKHCAVSDKLEKELARIEAAIKDSWKILLRDDPPGTASGNRTDYIISFIEKLIQKNAETASQADTAEIVDGSEIERAEEIAGIEPVEISAFAERHTISKQDVMKLRNEVVAFFVREQNRVEGVPREWPQAFGVEAYSGQLGVIFNRLDRAYHERMGLTASATNDCAARESWDCAAFYMAYSRLWALLVLQAKENLDNAEMACAKVAAEPDINESWTACIMQLHIALGHAASIPRHVAAMLRVQHTIKQARLAAARPQRPRARCALALSQRAAPLQRPRTRAAAESRRQPP